MTDIIRFLDLTRQHKQIEAELSDALFNVLNSGQFILSDEVAAFETEWADYCGASAAVGVGNGTDALALALMASGAVRRGRGDEVITTPLTAGYTALAILNAGGVPVFADIDPQTYTLDPASVERMITPHTRAIVPVHVYGQMCDMVPLCEVAQRHHLSVFEDAAQAHGARYRGQTIGSFSKAATFSFYPTKNLGAYGDGGAIVSQDAHLIARLRRLREGGHEPAITEGIEGRNSRLDELQAAVLRVKLEQLDRCNEERKSIARYYGDRLASVAALRLPFERDAEAHVYHLYVVQHPKRNELRAHLAARGIETKIHYSTLLHRERLFFRSEQPPLPVAEVVAPCLLSLPLYAQLSAEEVEAVVHAVLSFT